MQASRCLWLHAPHLGSGKTCVLTIKYHRQLDACTDSHSIDDFLAYNMLHSCVMYVQSSQGVNQTRLLDVP